MGFANICLMELEELQTKLCYKFNNINMLCDSLTHSSFSNERKTINNERLEFLGDAVLELVITDMLMKLYTEKAEGELSKARSMLVSSSILAKMSRNIDLGKHIRLGKGEENSGGRTKDSILSSTLEAVIAGIYFDGGYDAAYEVVNELFSDYVSNVFSEGFNEDFKTKLQELVQSEYKTCPVYELVSVDGPPHNRIFEIKVCAAGLESFGKGSSKKQAEQLAAFGILQQIHGGSN
jgi:ribonuclease III